MAAVHKLMAWTKAQHPKGTGVVRVDFTHYRILSLLNKVHVALSEALIIAQVTKVSVERAFTKSSSYSTLLEAETKLDRFDRMDNRVLHYVD